MRNNEERTLTFDFRSVRFKTWIYIMGLSAIILLLLWVVQLVFFNTSYRSMKVSEIKRSGDKMVKEYDDHGRFTPDTPDYLQNLVNGYALSSGSNIMVMLDNGAGKKLKLAYSGSLGIGGETETDVDFWQLIFGEGENAEFYEKLNAAEDGSCAYSSNLSGRGEFIVYGARRHELSGQVYFCMVSPMRASDATTAVLTNQLLIVTSICLILGIVLSYFISNKISRPITEFSQVARKLGKGDYSVRFTGNGYTEIDDLADTLNYATEEMGKTEALRRDFLANVSHDLRTPLTMVKAYAEMIRDISGENKRKREEHAQVIIDEADRLAALVGDILNLSKLQAGTDELEIVPFDLGALTRTVLERFGIMSEREGYVFETGIESGIVVSGDYKRIEQVLYNLIGNAVNYTGEDKRVSVRVSKTAGGGRFSVTDTGKGISPEEIDAVWDKYYRASMTKRKVVGSGLGLSIVKSILIRHDAEYGIDSQPGKGSTFWFELGSAPASEAEG